MVSNASNATTQAVAEDQIEYAEDQIEHEYRDAQYEHEPDADN